MKKVFVTAAIALGLIVAASVAPSFEIKVVETGASACSSSGADC